MKKNLFFLFFIIFIDTLGIGILIPIVPQILGDPTSAYYLLSPEQKDLGFFLLGLLVASYPVEVFFAAPILGALSDKYGRKPILVVSILGTSISYFVFAYAIFTQNIPLLFLSRIFDGITGGNISVAQAAIADLTSRENRTRNYGMMGSVFGLGFIFGPFLGGVLSSPAVHSSFDVSTPFIFSGILALCSAVFLTFFFKESIIEKARERKINLLASFYNIAKANKFSSLRFLFVVSLLFSLGITFYTSFFNVYLTNKFGFSAADIGAFFAYVGVCIIFTQLFIVGAIAKRFSEIEILGPAYLASGIMIAAFLVPNIAWQVILIVPIAAIPHGLQHANFISLLTKKADPDMLGEVLGVQSSISSIGQALPPIFAGSLAAIFAPGMPIFISALFIISAGIIFIKKVKPYA